MGMQKALRTRGACCSSRGVAEYLRALVATNASAEYLPDEQSGRPSSLPSLVGADPIHKATIMPRGSALGMVSLLPSSNETSISKKELLAHLDVCMGGRVAEELIFGKTTLLLDTSSDLDTATEELASYMVATCGMSDEIDPVHFKKRPGSEMESRIDAEVVKLLGAAYNRVKALLEKHKKALHALANSLMEYEAPTAEEIKRVLLPYT
ncbi:UNVERIFIED_CONTAM: ATP-dependent zinc metalloprotease FTSH 11, chloroplastic/mitochondrial [Sesamum calycinum]|uniref:ATP-dependent zinc metalloprotease FTSH 11, chloroplastic/mitochondrial n=1 Tax=Sesamum calycinum TaxID=2727403 RepID=A0AAW2RQN3_9LAMI